ncbi:MAG: hypothetical protein AB1505_00325 [Candidatus Latescibacterota bacterium]
MEARGLKERFGARLTFWGGAVDTQATLPFGTPEQVYDQACERIRTFAPGGGFVFTPIHNVQHGTPAANVLALSQALRDLGRYPP